MARLRVIIESPADPTLADPHEVAEDIIDAYNEVQRANGEPQAEFVRADWEE